MLSQLQRNTEAVTATVRLASLGLARPAGSTGRAHLSVLLQKWPWSIAVQELNMCVADNALQLALVCSTAGAAAGPDGFGLPEARRLAIRHGYVFDGTPADACDAKRADLSGKRHQWPASCVKPHPFAGLGCTHLISYSPFHFLYCSSVRALPCQLLVRAPAEARAYHTRASNCRYTSHLLTPAGHKHVTGLIQHTILQPCVTTSGQ